MMRDWLMNPAHFCISPNGDFANNTDDCYWGLPSIEASDPVLLPFYPFPTLSILLTHSILRIFVYYLQAFPALGYWRGYVWGPMVQLVYWGLERFDHVPSVRQGRKALCKQMTAMMLNQWRLNAHVCENFSPHKDEKECTGTSPKFVLVISF